MSYVKPLDSPSNDYDIDKDKFNAVHVENQHLDAGSVGSGQGRILHIRSAEEKQAELRAAQLADPGLNPWSYRGFTFGLTVLCVCLCGGDNGFDGTIMSSINSMTQYQKFFGLQAASAKTGIIFGIYTVGGVVAFIPASILPDKIGRRYSMMFGNLILIIGAIVSANAKNKGMFLAGRFLTGLGCTTAATCAKSYMAEITSPASRGRFMGLLNSFYYVGQILASGVAIPLGRVKSNNSWRISLWVQAIPALINFLTIWMCVESPRWLYAQGRKEEAINILARLHSRTADVNSPLIQYEIREIEENVSLQGSDKRFWDFRPLVRRASDRHRLGLALIVSVWGQLSGNGLVTYFLPVLLGLAGIKSPDRQRVLSFVNSVTSFIGALTGTAVVDKVGRRKLMLFASFCCCAGMAIVAALTSPAGRKTPAGANAGIAFIYLFMVFYSVGWTPLQGLYPTEILRFENRAKGLAAQGLATQAVSCINTFGLPPALAALSWKTYLIFACFDVLGIIVIWTFVVETKQIPLEDLDVIFEAKSPKQASFAAIKAARQREKEIKSSTV